MIDLLLSNIANFKLVALSSLFLTSAFILIITSLVVLYRGYKRIVNVTYFLISCCVTIFLVSYVIGVNSTDDYLSLRMFQFHNAVDILISVLFVTWCLSLTRKSIGKYRPSIIFGFSGLVILVAIILYPNYFVDVVGQKLYLNNYPSAGILFHAMLAHFVVAFLYGIYVLYKEFKISTGPEKNRIRYAIYGSIIGYLFGSSTFFLIYDFPVDPIIGGFTGLYGIIISYAIVKHQLMDINVVFKKTFVYAALVGILSWVVFIITLANQWFVNNVTWAQNWMVPVLSSIISISIFYVVWSLIEKSDRTRYEFTTIATHKFRTPLTRLKHGIDLLKEDKDVKYTKELSKVLENLSHDTEELIELTGLVLRSESYSTRKLHMSELDLVDLLYEVLNRNRHAISAKNINVDLIIDTQMTTVNGDKKHLISLIEIILDNALHYSFESSRIYIELRKCKKLLNNYVACKITDEGIGISHKDRKKVFVKFYRSVEAKKRNTEGTGLGLYLAKQIVKDHKGKIYLRSSARGNGTSVSFELPYTFKKNHE